MSDRIRIHPAGGTWVVRAGGAVIGESTRALRLAETGLEPVIYFPREDIATEFLDPSDTVISCRFKGAARHFSIVTKSTTLKDAVWSYEDPLEAALPVRDHLAFRTGEKVAVEQV